MKKILVVFLAAALLFSLAGTACADGGTWHCDTCDADRDSAFCPDCGAARPAVQEGEESVKPWPVMELAGIDSALRPLSDDEQRHQSYFGPSADYPGDGAYKPKKATSVKALLREGDFVLTDLTYQTVGRRILYFKASALTNSDVESVTLTGYPAKTLGAIAPKQGPGPMYDDLLQTKRQDMSGFEHIDGFSWYDYETGTWTEVEGFWVDFDSGVIVDNPKTERFTVYLKEGADLSVFFETNGWVYAEFNCTLGKARGWLPAATVE